MATVHHRYATVQGHKLFYREAGPADAPAALLLHGFPTSSFMFRGLIPALADRYHVIAPDLLGFGYSDAPPADDFEYTFDALADLTAALLDQLGANRYAIYVQDYGAPIGWRLTLTDPSPVSAIITQNGNGYDAGFVPGFWQTVWDSPMYPAPHEYLRRNRPPVLAVWGADDPIFGPGGARAFAKDVPGAEIHLLTGGH
jgi:pimeloyl-ACP methyl ester carboxylesterase